MLRGHVAKSGTKARCFAEKQYTGSEASGSTEKYLHHVIHRQ